MIPNDRMKSMLFDYPTRIPVSVGILPAAWMKHREALDEIVHRHPFLFGAQTGQRDYDAIGSTTYVYGDHVDAWGCVWSNIKTGMEAIVTGHPAPTREAVRALKIPEKDDGIPHGFMYLRLADIRGFEEIMIDFAEEPPELQMLLDMVLAYNVRQVKKRLDAATTPGQIFTFGDDLGIQAGLPISPTKWRKFLKPCFMAIYQPIRTAGHYVYMHTDGHIFEIIPDLIDCGVNVVNPQVGANGLENLARVCKEKVCVDLDLNRQMFPFWKPENIDAHVREAVEVLGSPAGGLWLKAEIGDDVPLENIEAIFAALEKYSAYYSDAGAF
jgi:uroporphyrinogen decarboxylase